jgi:hypothetical protein
MSSGLSLELSTIEDMLNKGLSDCVASLFSESVPIPFSHVEIHSVSQETHPIPAKWPTEVGIEDEAVFFEAREEVENRLSTEASCSDSDSLQEEWDGVRFFHASVEKLGLNMARLAKLVESETEIASMYGSSQVDLSRAKKIVKNELKEYDNSFKNSMGHEPSRADKEPMRQLYTLYRKIREMIVHLEALTSVPAPSPQAVMPRVDRERTSMEDRLEALYAEKQQLRTVLNDFQNKFMQEQGRRIKYHRDIVSIDREYRQYKQVKEEISKLENQLGRTPPSRKQSGNDFFI